MADYFPDKYAKNQQCDKKYMYNIWNTLHPEDVKRVIEYANTQRYATEAEEMKKDTILITEEW